MQLGSISIHALLAESDPCARCIWRMCGNISIHALLAESDPAAAWPGWWTGYFYPRSPCGERPGRGKTCCCGGYFYPRSPCGERPYFGLREVYTRGISIHALLAESDPTVPPPSTCLNNFYPRSPCGERLHH